MIHVVWTALVPSPHLGVPRSPLAPPLEQIAVPYDIQAVPRALDAIDKAMRVESWRPNLALLAGFEAYVSLLAVTVSGRGDPRKTTVALDGGQPSYAGLPLYLDREAGDHAVRVVSRGAAVASEAETRAAIDRRRNLPAAEMTTCQGIRDGDCWASNCPQRRDGEPTKTGRHCPLDTRGEEP